MAADDTARESMDGSRPGPVGSVLWLAGAGLCAAATVWLVASIDSSPAARPGWPEAAARIEKRLGSGELILVHRAGLVSETEALAGLPAACDPRSKRVKLERQRPDSLWIAGEKKINAKLRKLLARYASKGTISFDEVHLYHGWKPKDKIRNRGKKPRGRK